MNLQDFSVQEMNSQELIKINGGDWFGDFAESVGEAIGAVVGFVAGVAVVMVHIVADAMVPGH